MRVEGEKTRTLVELLRTVALGALITHEAIIKAIGVSDKAAASGFLNTARRRLLREELILFDTVRGEGLRRCIPGDTVGRGTFRRGVHRASGRDLKRCEAEAVNYEGLTNQQQNTLNVETATAGVLRLSTTMKTQKKLAAAVEESNVTLTAAEAALRIAAHNQKS